MKGYSKVAIVVGVLMLIFGTIFALQGEGTIGGSGMSNVPFWIYAGSAMAIIGVVIAVIGGWTGSRSPKPKTKTA